MLECVSWDGDMENRRLLVIVPSYGEFGRDWFNTLNNALENQRRTRIRRREFCRHSRGRNGSGMKAEEMVLLNVFCGR